MPSFTLAGSAWANTSAAAASSWLRSAAAGPVASNPRVHQASPRAELSEFHRAPWPLARSRDVRPGRPAVWREPADPALFAHHLPASWVTAAVTGRVPGKGPLQPVLQAAAGVPGHLEGTRAPAVRLYLQRSSPAYLHGEPGHVRIHQIGVLDHRRLGGKAAEPSGHRRRQPAREDPAHLQAADSCAVPVPRRRGRHRPRPGPGRAATASAGTAAVASVTSSRGRRTAASSARSGRPGRPGVRASRRR